MDGEPRDEKICLNLNLNKVYTTQASKIPKTVGILNTDNGEHMEKFLLML